LRFGLAWVVPDAVKPGIHCVGWVPDAVKPGIHCARTHWIRGFMAFHWVRRRERGRGGSGAPRGARAGGEPGASAGEMGGVRTG
jgi:hypothetical protein